MQFNSDYERRDDLETLNGNQRTHGLSVFVGDNATTKNIRSVKANATDLFSKVTETPGDLHAGGYVFERFAASQGPGDSSVSRKTL